MQVFIRLQTQWLWSGGMAPQRTGLNYAALDFTLKAAGIRPKKVAQVFDDLQLMENASLDAWNKQYKLEQQRKRP